MYLESIPINTSDGYADLFEIDPSGLPLCRGVHESECAASCAKWLGGAVNF
jgi:hypothetical protein